MIMMIDENFLLFTSIYLTIKMTSNFSCWNLSASVVSIHDKLVSSIFINGKMHTCISGVIKRIFRKIDQLFCVMSEALRFKVAFIFNHLFVVFNNLSQNKEQTVFYLVFINKVILLKKKMKRVIYLSGSSSMGRSLHFRGKNCNMLSLPYFYSCSAEMLVNLNIPFGHSECRLTLNKSYEVSK